MSFQSKLPQLASARRSGRSVPALLLLVACSLALAAPAARAQVFMNCQPVPLPSAYPSDWSSTQSLCRLLMTNQAGEPVRCDLRVRLDQNGDTASVVVPRQFDVGPTFLTTPQVTNWSRLVFQGSLKDALNRTGHLSAAPIRVTVFCENMFGLVSNNPIPAVQATITIIPSVPPPPTLLTPADASQMHVTNPVFTWTPVRLTTGQEVWYQFRLVRVLAGQTPARALEANYAVLETFLHQSNLPYPPAAPRLEAGSLYAWRVQALVNASTDVNNVPAPGNYSHLGLNEGRSRVYSFVWQSAADGDAVASARASRRNRGEDDRLGSLIGIGSDDHPAPAVSPEASRAAIHRRVPTPADSIALALFTPQRNWWGPASATRARLTNGAVRAQDAGGLIGGDDRGTAGDTKSGDIDGTQMGETSGSTGATGAPARAPMQVDTSTPEGGGFATRWLRISGTSVAAGEVYTHTGAGLPSRPDNNGQFIAGMTVSTLNDKLHIPLQALVSGDQVSFRQSVSQVAVHPEWHWGGLHAGNINPGYSSFSLADATLLGGGADIVRGRWYVGFVDGRTQKAIRPDTLNAVEARYARNVMAGRVGYGKPLGNALEFEVMRARDDEGSLSSSDTLVHIAPAGNMVYGARARHTMIDTCTTVQIEGALSRYDRNVNADVPEVNGGAGGVRLQRRTMQGEVGAAFDYVGGGFITLANSELAADRMEGRLNARRDMFEGKLHVGGTAGLRRDDISKTLGGTTRRQSFGAQVGWQPAALFGADFDMGILSSRSPATDQRAGLKDLTTSYTLSPRLAWKWFGAAQSFSSSVCLQATDYSDADAAGFANTRNTSVVAGWQSSVTSSLFLNVSGNYVKSEAGGFASEISSVGPGLSMTMLGGRAQTNLQLQLTETHIPGLGSQRDLAPSVDLRYLVTGRQMLVFRAGMRRFRAPASTLSDFDERQATLQYSAAL